MGLADRLHSLRVYSHEVLAGNLDNLAVLDEATIVVQSHKHTDGRPRELVSEGVVRGLSDMSADLRGNRFFTHSRLGETTTVALEARDLSSGLVNLVDNLDGVQVVDSGVCEH
jgi:hypothetical protein